MRSRLPRATGRTGGATDTLPTDRTPDRRPPRNHGSPAMSAAEREIARPKHLSADERAAKLLDDAANRKRLARLVYRRRVAEPDLLDPDRVHGAAPLPATEPEALAAPEFALLAEMLGLNGDPS